MNGPSSGEPLAFAPEAEARPTPVNKAWKILVADDDEEVHAVTRLVLRDLVFDGRPLHLLAAHSAAETLEKLSVDADVAVLLLDVVMETESAGLAIVRDIRERLGNRFVRIILRTGQPGQAPEKRVVIEYDINDYKEKTELTAQKLVTAVVSALRAYRDIVAIEKSRQGLTQIIDASRDLFAPKSLSRLSSGVLQQIGALLHFGSDGLVVQASGLTAKRNLDTPGDEFVVIAGCGRFADTVGTPLEAVLDAAELARLLATRPQKSYCVDGEFVGHFVTSNGSESFVLVQAPEARDQVDLDLLHLFSVNVGIAFDNAHLHEELAATQAELVHTLSEVVETRSNETGLHVYRVGELSRLLAERVGHDERECQLLRSAAPMHDLGKIGIADAILNKPGPLTPAEWEIMRRHTSIGYQLLHRSRRPALGLAAVIAHQHHEWWDGSGYPSGLKGEAIHPFGRIVALIDVFDALTHPRCYKKAWDLEQAIDHIRQRRGRQFEPRLVDTFLAHLDEFVALWRRYPDSQEAATGSPDPAPRVEGTDDAA